MIENITQLELLLEQRGVTGVGTLLESLGEDFNVHACLEAIARYDRDGAPGSGLLVFRVREAAASNFVPADQRNPVGPAEITPRLLRAIRGSCNSPNGYTRDEARGMLADKAKRMRLDPDVLIDAAMGADWQETPVHSALSKDGTPVERLARYERWVAGNEVAGNEEVA